MANYLHGAVSLLCKQTSFVFPSSLPLTSSPLPRSSIPWCHSDHHLFKRYNCSNLRTVHCAATGSNDAESAKSVGSRLHDLELPPLAASMAITCLPPCQESMFADEALQCILKRSPFHWLEPHNRVCNSLSSFLHRSAVSCDRLAVMSSVYTLVTFLDDNIFDSQSGIHLREVGIDHNILDTPSEIREYLRSVDTLLRQEEPLQSTTQIQEMIWKLGCDLRELSNPEWFNLFADAMLDFNISNLESYSAELVGDRTYITDLKLFTRMRERNSGSIMCTYGVEFCTDRYLPSEIRDHPVVQKLTVSARKYFACVNDIFSYSKEIDEPQSRNLLKVLMESEDLLLPRAAWRAVNFANSVAQDFLEVEAHMSMHWEDEPRTLDVVRCYAERLKEFMSGAFYWHSLQKRYRHHKAPFPELRDVSGASFSPRAKGFKRVI